MNNKFIWILIALLIVGAGAFAFMRLGNNSPSGTDTAALGVVMIAGAPNAVWEGNEISPITSTLTLKNGTTVDASGSITDKAGTKVTLAENEYLSTEGERKFVNISIYKLRETDTGTVPIADSTGKHGDYKDYTPQTVALDQAAGKKVVLYFTASWCPFCKAANKAFLEKIAQIPEDISILKVDYDTSTDLKKKYGVTYQHTFIQIDKDGNQVSKWSGGDIENLKKYMK